MKDVWNINFEWKQEWNNFDPNHLIFVTDENVLLDNIEKRIKESDYNVDLANEMLQQIGIKSS